MEIDEQSIWYKKQHSEIASVYRLMLYKILVLSIQNIIKIAGLKAKQCRQ